MSREGPTKAMIEFRKNNSNCKCANCNSNEDINIHHIVPLSIGGNDVITNLIPLCGNCHALVHGIKKESINHSALIKEGMKKAKENGISIGRKTTKKDDILEYDNLIRECFASGLDISKTAKKLKISRPTLYKYCKILEISLPKYGPLA